MIDGYEIVYLDEMHDILHEVYKLTIAGSMRSESGNKWIMNEPGNPCKLDAAFDSQILRKVSEIPKVRKIAENYLKTTELDTYISKFFPMLPRKGFSVDWHQDNHYIQADPGKMVSCDVFLKGATPEMGGLRLIPGSHRANYPHTKYSHDGVFQWMQEPAEELIVDINIPTPFAIIFDVNLVHGCYKNVSDQWRPSIAWEYKHKGYLPPSHNGHQSQDIYGI